MSKLTKAVALIVLALWGLALMHCKLEALPGLDFLKSCCFAGSIPSSSNDCDSDGCKVVEDGDYRAEEQNTWAPQPVAILAWFSPSVEIPLLKLSVSSLADPPAPPELSRCWQFSCRAALPPRAPSLVS